jgi:glycosyltransferase involved in cell wall biosynthesis
MVSIIIPVYNVAPYVRECLDSVINQTFTDWEGILVDDGSTDGSGAICDEYASSDKRFRVIHQANKGITEVRNMGLKEAKGEYIAWVDSDDAVHPKWLETLYNIITSNPCDIAVVESVNCYNGQIQSDVDEIERKEAIFITVDQAVDNLFNNGINGFTANMWTKLYRRDFVGNSSFVISSMAEDMDFNLQMALKGARIYCSETPLYYYRHRTDSITGAKDHDNLLKDMIVRCDIYDHYRTLDAGMKYKAIILESVYQNLLYAKNHSIYTNSKPSPSDENYILEVYRRTLDDFKNCDEISKGMKTKVALLLHAPKLYYLMVKAKKKLLYR